MKRMILTIFSLLLFANLIFPHASRSDDVLIIPSLIIGLRHNVNQQTAAPNQYMVFFSAATSSPAQRIHGGDLGAELHRGYDWWMIMTNPSAVPATTKLPPGLVLGLAHSKNQAGQGISVYGQPTITGPNTFPGFKKQHGGDLGAPAGHGYYWYESTGEGFNDWKLIDRLPKWTVLGLKHSKNQRDKRFVWNGKVYDPANASIAPPAGFVRVFGGDLGAPAGHGFFWYEKTTGPEVVVKPHLNHRLARSLMIAQGDPFSLDRDRDYLVDSLENELANVFRPYLVFDSDEKARKSHEPVTLFRVYPVDLTNPSALKIRIKWLFLFLNDGGYGPSATPACKNAHKGDNDDAFYELGSGDGGLTWSLLRVNLSFKGIEWPINSRLEVYDVTHPIIYFSASKHHEYLNRDHDHKRYSRYSESICTDDVNGQGGRFLADLQSVTASNFNNVGEFFCHPPPWFVNDLGRYFPGYQAWGDKKFYEVDSLRCKWLPSCGR